MPPTRASVVRFHFRLRTLLLIVTVSAVLLGAWVSVRDRRSAAVTWIDPVSPSAAQLAGRSDASILGPGRANELVSRARRARISRITRYGPHVTRDVAWFSTNHLYQDAKLISPDDSLVKTALDRCRKADVLAPGTFAINGIVEDRDGFPIGHGWVDLLGPKSHVDKCRTRSDGTFTMIVAVPPGRGYCLQIRGLRGNELDEDHRTTWFSLRPSNPELVAVIRVLGE